MLERGLCCLLLCRIMQHRLGSRRQRTSEVWDHAREPVPDDCGEGPLCSLAAGEGAGALGVGAGALRVEHLPAAQAGSSSSGRWGAGRREKHAARTLLWGSAVEAAGCAFCSVLPSQACARKHRTVKYKPHGPWCLLAGRVAGVDAGERQQLCVAGSCLLTCD